MSNVPDEVEGTGYKPVPGTEPAEGTVGPADTEETDEDEEESDEDT